MKTAEFTEGRKPIRQQKSRDIYQSNEHCEVSGPIGARKGEEGTVYLRPGDGLMVHNGSAPAIGEGWIDYLTPKEVEQHKAKAGKEKSEG